ncbi:MAG: amino acid permease, partial [Bacteroidetes bacterium]
MAKDLKELFARKVIPVSFERTINLFGATTIGVGALMGAGVYVLIGLAAGKAGPSVWLSYVACGALAFVTTLMFAELARRVPRSGGGYTYAYETLGSFGGFATGWFLALGSIFACGLYAIGFAEYFSSLLGYDLHKVGVRALAIGFVLFSTWINARGTSGTEKFQGLLTWGNLGVLLVFVLFAAFHARPELLKPHFPNGLAGTFSTIGIIYISFFGYQLIANNADEIIDPKRTVPRAMILSMGIALTAYLLIALVSVMAVPWQELAKSSTPLVEVAILSFGPAGWLLISVGGVLASAGALNSTLLSQARQIYAMGKNRFFPALLGEVHQAYKTPFAALFAGGLLVVLFLMLFPLEFIAKAANFCLLVSLLPVSLALRRLYREQSRSNGEPV